jgi:hypothetical protein
VLTPLGRHRHYSTFKTLKIASELPMPSGVVYDVVSADLIYRQADHIHLILMNPEHRALTRRINQNYYF